MDDLSLRRSVLDLLEYANIHLSSDTGDNRCLYRKLCLLLGIAPCGMPDYVPDGASLEKLAGPATLLSRFPEKIRYALMGALLPLPSRLIELFNSVLDGGNIRDAMDWFYDFGVKSGYVLSEDSENNIHWQPAGEKGGLQITINTSRDNDSHCDPLRLPPEDASSGILERELPVFLRGEDWCLRFSPYNLFPQHFVFSSKTPDEGRAFSETLSSLLDAVEYFPQYFFAGNGKGGGRFFGGLQRLPLFSAAPRIEFGDPDGFVRVSVPDWYNTAIRIESAQRHAILAAAEKVSRAWENYSEPDSDAAGGKNCVSLIARVNGNGEYCAELILRSDKLGPRDSLIVPGGIGVIESMGSFVLPGAIAHVAKCAYSLLSRENGAEEGLPDGLGQYSGILKDIAAKSSGTPENAEADIEGYIEKACEDALKAAAVFAEDARGNTALIKFMASLGLKIRR